MLSATQAQMEAATANDILVSPGRFIHHPMCPKAVAAATVSGTTVTIVHNPLSQVSSITRISTGRYTHTLATAMSSSNWAAYAMGDLSAIPLVDYASRTTTSIEVRFYNFAAAPADPGYIGFLAWGDR